MMIRQHAARMANHVRKLIGLTLLTSLVAVYSAPPGDSKWESLQSSMEPMPQDAIPWRMNARYSFGMATQNDDEGSVWFTHGYFFDHKRNNPNWLQDTWKFSPRTLQWTSIQTPQDVMIPMARYSSAFEQINGQFYMFGGDDGGLRLTHKGSYTPGNYFSDMWTLIPDPDKPGHARWWLVGDPHSSSIPSSKHLRDLERTWPTRRTLFASAVVDGKMYIMGGLASTMLPKDDIKVKDLYVLNDLWVFTPEGRNGGEWEEVIAHGQAGSPPPRKAFDMVGREGHGTDGKGELWLYSGTEKGAKDKALNDLWKYDIGSGEWTEIKTPGGPTYWTNHHTVSLVEDSLIIFGGNCNGKGCVTTNATWEYNIPKDKWIDLGNGPMLARYRHKTSPHKDGKGFYLYGGECYSPYTYHDDLWSFRLNIDNYNPQKEREDREKRKAEQEEQRRLAEQRLAAEKANADDKKRDDAPQPPPVNFDGANTLAAVLAVAAMIVGAVLLLRPSKAAPPPKKSKEKKVAAGGGKGKGKGKKAAKKE